MHIWLSKTRVVRSRAPPSSLAWPGSFSLLVSKLLSESKAQVHIVIPSPGFSACPSRSRRNGVEERYRREPASAERTGQVRRELTPRLSGHAAELPYSNTRSFRISTRLFIIFDAREIAAPTSELRKRPVHSSLSDSSAPERSMLPRTRAKICLSSLNMLNSFPRCQRR